MKFNIQSLKLFIKISLLVVNLVALDTLLAAPPSNEEENLPTTQDDPSVHLDKMYKIREQRIAKLARIKAESQMLHAEIAEKSIQVGQLEAKLVQYQAAYLAKQAEVTTVRRALVTFRLATDQYRIDQVEQVPLYQKLIKKFRRYQSEQLQVFHSFKDYIGAALASQDNEAFAGATQKVNAIYDKERKSETSLKVETWQLLSKLQQNDNKLQSALDPFRSGLNQARISSSLSSTQLLPKTTSALRQIVSSAEMRLNIFKEVLGKSSPLIKQHFKSMVQVKVEQELAEYRGNVDRFNKEEYWLNVTNDFEERLDQFMSSASQEVGQGGIQVGCQLKLHGLYTVYLEILSAQLRCIQELPDFHALDPLVSEAKFFFTRGAWDNINNTIIDGKRHAPAHLGGFVQQLQTLKETKKSALETPEILLPAIETHDQFIDEWQDWLSKEGDARASVGGVK